MEKTLAIDQTIETTKITANFQIGGSIGGTSSSDSPSNEVLYLN